MRAADVFFERGEFQGLAADRDGVGVTRSLFLPRVGGPVWMNSAPFFVIVNVCGF
jgi:hypothetical protein